MSRFKNVSQQWERIQRVRLAYYRLGLSLEITGEFTAVSFSGMSSPAS